MSFRDGVHRFLDIIGIVRSDEPDEPAASGRGMRAATLPTARAITIRPA